MQSIASRSMRGSTHAFFSSLFDSEKSSPSTEKNGRRRSSVLAIIGRNGSHHPAGQELLMRREAVSSQAIG